jgi:hypothetical protein
MALELAETAEHTLATGSALNALCLLSAIPAFLPDVQRVEMGRLLCEAVKGNLNYGDAILGTIKIVNSVQYREAT